MSAVSAARRAEVMARAGYRCEYSHLPTRGQVATFPIDHILPRTAGGTSELDNLALACPHCNAHKWAAQDAADPETGENAPFFNPRHHAWDQHFEWSPDRTGELLGKTAIGRATVLGLRINDADMIQLRLFLAEVGVIQV